MAEKVIEKLKRLSTDLAESVRAEVELGVTVRAQHQKIKEMKKLIVCYLSDKENIKDESECLSFLRGYHDAKTSSAEEQMTFKF